MNFESVSYKNITREVPQMLVFLKSFEPWNVVTKQKPYFKIYRPGGINFHRDLLSHGLILVGRATF